MNLHALRLFNQVAHRGSFSAAAASLRISQPAVSKAIAELEASLEQKLFDRATKPVSLTRAGKALFRHSEAIFNAERDAQIELQGLRMPAPRMVRLAASACLAQHALAAPVLAFRAAYPHIRVAVSEGNLHQVASDLGSGAVELAIVEGILPGFEHLALRPWIEQELRLFAPVGHPLLNQAGPLDHAAIADQTMILRESGSATLGFILTMLPGVDANDPRHIFASSTTAMVALAAAGGGLVLAPVEAADPMVAAGRLVALDLGRRFHRTCSIATVQAGESRAEVRAFEDFLTAELSARSELSV